MCEFNWPAYSKWQEPPSENIEIIRERKVSGDYKCVCCGKCERLADVELEVGPYGADSGIIFLLNNEHTDDVYDLYREYAKLDPRPEE